MCRPGRLVLPDEIVPLEWGKIDRSFVSDIATSAGDDVVAR